MDPTVSSIGPLDIEKKSNNSSMVGGDVEKALHQITTTRDGLEADTTDDPLLVTWDGPNDSSNPYNWSLTTKWAATLLTSLGGMVTLMSSNMIAPALPSISHDLHIDDATTQLTMSIFVLSYAFGPMVLAPMTEVFGRKPVWLLCGSFYIVWNTVCGFSKTNGLLIAGRLLSGLGASAEFAIGTPVLADIWLPEQRGQSLAIATFLPLLGPAIGPILGGVLTDSLGWRWLFWILSIFDAILTLSAFFIFPETYAPVILHHKAKNLRKQTGLKYYTISERESPALSKLLVVSLGRPVRLLLTQPLIQVMSVFLAYNFGILFIVHSTFATLWIEKYHQSVSVSGLHYIALALGCISASVIGGFLMDKVWQHLKYRANGETKPEYRVPLMLPPTLLIPLSLLLYGWTAQKNLHFLLPDLGIFLFGAGIILSTQAMQAYVMDSFPIHVASASAASQLLRSIAGFTFPLFAPSMYKALGYGWGNSVLALGFLVVLGPAPWVLWRFGGVLRGSATS